MKCIGSSTDCMKDEGIFYFVSNTFILSIVRKIGKITHRHKEWGGQWMLIKYIEVIDKVYWSNW
jgi:hypothetical protein